MDKLFLMAVGFAAAVYLIRIAWKSVKGQGTCNCGSSGTCSGKPGECCCTINKYVKK
ncbi:MAG: hypothetical protein LLG02_16040 [Pelosinus sp.]|nr:hypothetical protein [Pelosinus sp.]